MEKRDKQDKKMFHKNKTSLNARFFYIWWAFRDLNPGQTGYEPVALTN